MTCSLKCLIFVSRSLPGIFFQKNFIRLPLKYFFSKSDIPVNYTQHQSGNLKCRFLITFQELVLQRTVCPLHSNNFCRPSSILRFQKSSSWRSEWGELTPHKAHTRYPSTWGQGWQDQEFKDNFSQIVTLTPTWAPSLPSFPFRVIKHKQNNQDASIFIRIF